jgi:uncharacterized protein YaiL (DUF2058 family)
MSTDTTGAAATEATGTEPDQQAEARPTETVEFWKAKAREQEKRAKDNAAAAKRLVELEDAQKTEAERAAERVAKAEAEVATVPAKVSEALRKHLIELHEIDQADADLFLTATDPDVLLKQVGRWLQRADRRKTGLVVRREGTTQTTTSDDPMRALTKKLFEGARSE